MMLKVFSLLIQLQAAIFELYAQFRNDIKLAFHRFYKEPDLGPIAVYSWNY